jgi:hypothetical protein
MINDASWFFELDPARFKKVTLKTSGGEATISVLVYDDLGMAISETEETLNLSDGFRCDTRRSGVSFTVKGKRFHF